jgi:hypothetical protein
MELIVFLGTRQPRLLPTSSVELFRGAAEAVAARGQVVSTGATPGAEQMAAEAALAVGGKVDILLPWERYEAGWVNNVCRRYPDSVSLTIFDPDEHVDWLEAARTEHFRSEHLASGSLALIARTYGLVARSSALIVLPYVRATRPEPQPRRSLRGTMGRLAFGAPQPQAIIDKGGAELPIRLAEALSVPCYDLSERAERVRLAETLDANGRLDHAHVALV